MFLSTYKRTMLIGILATIGLLVASCGPADTNTPVTRGAGDTLALDDEPVTLARPIDATGLLAGIGAQQDDDVRTGKLETVDEVTTTFEDQREQLGDLRPNQIARWRQIIGFADQVTVTPPTGFEGMLPDVIVYNEAEFEATISDDGLDAEIEIEIESDDESPIRLVRNEGNIYTFEDAREFTEIRISGQEVQDLFEILTGGSEENQITFSLSLDYEIDGNTSIPEGTTFLFTLQTEFGFFNVR